MTVKEYNEADREVEAICKANQNRRRETEERRTAVLYSDIPDEETDGLMAHRWNQLKRVCYTCARVAPGLMFLGAIPRGWMDPGFAVICALGCMGAAAYYYCRGYRYG